MRPITIELAHKGSEVGITALATDVDADDSVSYHLEDTLVYLR